MKTNFAKSMAKQLKDRNGQTNEVSGVMHGEAYSKVHPSYTSKPDIAKALASNFATNEDDIDYNREYGVK